MNATKIKWENGVPISEEFDDVYFSKDDGLEESKYVFLQGNRLEERWKNDNSNFTIIETGFGTGLNFFATCLLWEKTRNNNEILNYISIEKHPLSKEDMIKASSLYPSLIDIFQHFICRYKDTTSSNAFINLKNKGITLTLLLEDVNTALPKLKTTADAWFLDGFSPSKNPDMWGANLYKEMRRLSQEGTTFSTFTSAGFVKRGLAENGFIVEKTKGFGRKRDMLTGHFPPKK